MSEDNGIIDGLDLTPEQHERERGRAEGAAIWPVVFNEGFNAGWSAAHNRLLMRVREESRDDPRMRTILIALLSD